MSTISKENYLKTVYVFNQNTKTGVTTSKVAEKLDISNAATSDMAKKLAENGLLNYRKYKGIDLTPAGEQMALNVLRRHRLWELFLMKVLNLSWSEVHDEAEMLEHQTSENLIDKIDEFLGFPEVDPHGSPIPKKNGELPNLPEAYPIAEAEVGRSCIISMVNDSDSELIKYLTELGIELDTKINVIQILPFDNSMIVEINGNTFTLSEKLSQNIFVINKD